MSFFILFISFLVIVIAMSGLYLCGERQIRKTLQGRWAYFAKHAKTTRCVAYGLLCLAGLGCIQHFGFPIGFVSFWIFATPIIFMLIIYINDLKVPQKVK